MSITLNIANISILTWVMENASWAGVMSHWVGLIRNEFKDTRNTKWLLMEEQAPSLLELLIATLSH